MKTALVIMAAGLGSRFGGGIKQLEPVGLNDEIIMDYSVHDAIESGFNKIVFIIRKDIEADFRERIGVRVEKVCAACDVEVEYVFQRLDAIPSEVPEGRTKPWGTGQAVLAAKNVINEPFAVINADDYYGKDAFVKVHDFLCSKISDRAYCMAGFILKNTLSENGTVTRGICCVDDDYNLTNIAETRNILKTADGAVVDGKNIDVNSYVSMNMWGLSTEFVKILEEGFEKFFMETVPSDPLKAEYLLPIYIGELLQKNEISVKVLETTDKWFGVTYKEDMPYVCESFRQLIKDGVYKEELYSDLV